MQALVDFMKILASAENRILFNTLFRPAFSDIFVDMKRIHAAVNMEILRI
jgi:hypothetical protein